MPDIAADPTHPRYQSLLMRHRLEEAAKKGMLADSALIAHGRGEAFDYLLGEQTTPSALRATHHALGLLMTAKAPVLSLNGNTVALAGREILQLAAQLKCPVEINIFYRTSERMNALLTHLKALQSEIDIDVTILGENPDARIPGLEGPRAQCCLSGIFDSDVVLVPLEDGDRCEALVAMGKTVIVVDLNPLSRTAQTATVTIVDELSRVIANMTRSMNRNPEELLQHSYSNTQVIESSLSHISALLSEK